jgi:hypothetical protein
VDGRGSSDTPENNPDRLHVVPGSKKRANRATPPQSTAQLAPAKDIFSSRKHSMEYVTVEGVKLRTGYYDIKDWYFLWLKEKLDNCVDWLQKNYQGTIDAAIDVRIEKTNDSMLRVKVRNTNPKNIPVFTKDQLSAIFDYDMTYGSKQNLHIISRGMLGDAMKAILSLPYVLIHTKDDGTAFTDKQWEHPLIIRCNKKEYHVFFHVNKAAQEIRAEPIDNSNGRELQFTDTEIEFVYPIITDEVELDIKELAQFCREYPIFTTDISFKFRLVDNSPFPLIQKQEKFSDNPQVRASNLDIEKAVAKTLVSPAPRATIKIEYPALHPISTKWRNIASIHSYRPTEFITFIESVADKENTSVDDRLRQLVEVTQMKKNTANEISIAQLLADPDKDKKLEKLFYEIKASKTSPEKLSLPFTIDDKRKEALVRRIARLYEGKLDTKKAVYKAIPDRYKDDAIAFPYLFEIIAIPYSNDAIKKNEDWCKTEFKGSVNYSVSSRGNNFEGEYKWDDPKKTTEFKKPSASDIMSILKVYNFYFYQYSDARAKLPCVIFANLVTPRVDYHGKDKSRIDTRPFTKTIINACRRTVEDIQTFKAAGWKFHTKSSLSFTPIRETEVSIEDVIEETLKQMRGGSD